MIVYICCALARDELDQRRGIVGLHMNIGPTAGSSERDVSVSNTVVWANTPIRLSATHIFVNPDNQEFSNEQYRKVDKSMQARVKLYRIPLQNYAQELHFILGTLGIPTDTLPLTKKGEFDLTYHNEFLKARRDLETKTTTSVALSFDDIDPLDIDIDLDHHDSSSLIADLANADAIGTTMILSPLRHDVLLGVDALAKAHPGNSEYLQIIDSHFDVYNSVVDRLQRRVVMERVLTLIHARGGRFLQRRKRSKQEEEEESSSSGWVEVSNEEAINKIGNSFRSRRRVVKKQQQRKMGK